MYKRLIGIALVYALVAAACLGAWVYVLNLKSTIRTLKDDNTVLTAQTAVLSQKILDQNAAVDALKADADARVKAADIMLEAAKVETAKAKARATTIYKTPPSTPDNDCKSALDLINGAAL